MRDGALIRREIDLSLIRPALSGCHNAMWRSVLLSEQDPLIRDPGETGGVRQKQGRLATEYWDRPCILAP